MKQAPNESAAATTNRSRNKCTFIFSPPKCLSYRHNQLHAGGVTKPAARCPRQIVLSCCKVVAARLAASRSRSREWRRTVKWRRLYDIESQVVGVTKFTI